MPLRIETAGVHGDIFGKIILTTIVSAQIWFVFHRFSSTGCMKMHDPTCGKQIRQPEAAGLDIIFMTS